MTMENKSAITTVLAYLEATTEATSNSTHDCHVDTLELPWVRATFILAYAVVFACCSAGNMLLLTVIAVHPAMHTVTNFFLANLAVADLLVALFCVLQNLMHLFIFDSATWPLGEFLCKMYVFIMHLIPCTSAGLLLTLSFERFVAIMRPIAARNLLTRIRLAVTTGFVWSVSIATNVPYYYLANYLEFTDEANTSSTTTDPSTGNSTFFIPKHQPEQITWQYCTRRQEPVFQRIMATFSFVFWYVWPLTAMIAIYSMIGVTLWRTTINGVIARASIRRRAKSRSTRLRMNGGNSSAGGSAEFIALTSQAAQVRCDSSRETRMLTNVNNKRLLAPVHDQSPVQCGDEAAAEAVDGRKRVIRLLVAIILAFALLTLPNHARFLTNVWYPTVQRCNNGFRALVQPLSYLLLFMNSGINPILYAFMSKKFRSAVREMFNRKALREQRRERLIASIRSTATTEFYTNTD